MLRNHCNYLPPDGMGTSPKKARDRIWFVSRYCLPKIHTEAASVSLWAFELCFEGNLEVDLCAYLAQFTLHFISGWPGAWMKTRLHFKMVGRLYNGIFPNRWAGIDWLAGGQSMHGSACPMLYQISYKCCNQWSQKHFQLRRSYVAFLHSWGSGGFFTNPTALQSRDCKIFWSCQTG